MEFEEIRIENTNRCSMSCFMCPRNFMTRRKGCMSYDEFVLLCERLRPFLISSKLNWLDLHGFGEPLLDKDLFKKIEYVNNHYKNVKTRIVTTFFRVVPESIPFFLSSGLTEIVISHYATSEEEFQKIHCVPGFEETRENINTLLFMNHKRSNTLQILIENLSMGNLLSKEQEEKRKTNIFLWHKQVIEMGGKIRNLSSPHNWGSAFSYRDISLGICSIVAGYRKRILQITWDGNIIPCCFDFNADVVFGNVFKDDIYNIFSSVKYKTFICNHKLNRLDNYPPCKTCNRCHIP